MPDTHLPDCRPPRRDDSLTSAASHPELLIGEIAMRPRIHVPLTPADRDTVSAWSRRMLTACALIAAPFIAHSVIYQYNDTSIQGARAEQRALATACVQWREAAGDAVSSLARSMSDADLRQLNDAVFRLRRARRNCEEGWVNLACQDYYAVARHMPGNTTAHESLFACRASAQ